MSLKNLDPLYEGKGRVAKRWSIFAVAALAVLETFTGVPTWIVETARVVLNSIGG